MCQAPSEMLETQQGTNSLYSRDLNASTQEGRDGGERMRHVWWRATEMPYEGSNRPRPDLICTWKVTRMDARRRMFRLHRAGLWGPTPPLQAPTWPPRHHTDGCCCSCWIDPHWEPLEGRSGFSLIWSPEEVCRKEVKIHSGYESFVKCMRMCSSSPTLSPS